MLNGNKLRKAVVLGCMLVMCIISSGGFAGEIGIREDGSVIYTKDDGTWILAIPTKTTIMVAVNKRDHELWTHPAVKKRLQGREPEDLSSKEAKSILKEMRDSGIKKYRDDIAKMVKQGEGIIGGRKKDGKNLESDKSSKKDSVTKQWVQKVSKKEGKKKGKNKKKVYGTIGLKDLPSLERTASMTDAQEEGLEKKLSHYILVTKAEIEEVDVGKYSVRGGDGKRKVYKYRIGADRPITTTYTEEKQVDAGLLKKSDLTTTKTVTKKKRIGSCNFVMYTDSDHATKLKKGQVSTIRGVITSFRVSGHNYYRVYIRLAHR